MCRPTTSQMLVNNNGKEKLTEQINKDKSQEKKSYNDFTVRSRKLWNRKTIFEQNLSLFDGQIVLLKQLNREMCLLTLNN